MAATYFADTSALGKRYVHEIGSSWLRGTIDPFTGSQVVIVRTTSVELISAISRREKGGSLTAVDAAKARTDFRADLATDYQVVEMSPHLAERAMDLAEKHKLRGFDAIQLAAALEVHQLSTALGLQAIILLSSDIELNTAATAEGLAVDDPNSHP